MLDFGPCMQPDLPCKDVAESMGRFSGPGGVSTGQVSDTKSGTLLKAHGEMEFVAVMGALVGDNFLPVKSIVWRLEDDHGRGTSRRCTRR